jgi:hypothetical protein
VHDTNSWIDVFGLSKAYEVDTYENLSKTDRVNDKLGNHHTPQKAPAKVTVGGYPQDIKAGSAPAIRLPEAEHARITSEQAKNAAKRQKMTPRQLLADDIRLLRKHTNAPNSSLQKLIDMNKKNYNYNKPKKSC